MTEGGPLNSSISLVMLINRVAFEQQRFGYGSAISLLLFAVIMFITYILFKIRARGESK